MTLRLGLGIHMSTIANLNKKVEDVVDRTDKLKLRASIDLAMMAGYSDQSEVKLKEYADRERLNRTIAGDVQKQILVCKERGEAMDHLLGRDVNLDDLSVSVEDQEASIGKKAFDYILSDPSMSMAMLQHWGPEWSAKLEEALQNLDRPSQLPIGIVKDLQSNLEGAKSENARLVADNATLAEELEAMRSLLAEERSELQSATERYQLAERQVHERDEQIKRLRDDMSSLARESAAFEKGLRRQAEQSTAQASLVTASINMMESTTDSAGQPEEDWNTLLQCIEASPDKLVAESVYNGWLWLDAWSHDDRAMVDTARLSGCRADQALMKLFFAFRRNGLSKCNCETLTLLQHVVYALASTTEVLEGLCRLAVDVINDLPALELPISLMLSQVLDVVSKQWPSVGADPLGFVLKQKQWLSDDDGVLIQALLPEPDEGVCHQVPQCTGTSTFDKSPHKIAVIESVDMFIQIDAHTRRLRWIEADCADWEKFTFRSLVLKAPSGAECIEVWPQPATVSVPLIKMKVRASRREREQDGEAWEGFSD